MPRRISRLGSLAMFLWALTAVRASAVPMVLDNFDTPSPGTYFFIPGPPGFGTPDPLSTVHLGLGIVGGSRELNVDVLGATVPESAAVGIGADVTPAGTLSVTMAGPSGTRVVLTYRGLGSQSEGPWETDLTGGGVNNALDFFFKLVDTGNQSQVNVKVELAGLGGSTAMATSGVNAYSPSGENTRLEHAILFNAFQKSGGFDFAHVTQITITVNESGVPNQDWAIDEIMAAQIVPEPSAAVLSGVGLFAVLVGTKRFRRRCATKAAT